MRDEFLPDEIYISSGSDETNNLKSFQKLLEDFQNFSGRHYRGVQIFLIGVLEQFLKYDNTSIIPYC